MGSPFDDDDDKDFETFEYFIDAVRDFLTGVCVVAIVLLVVCVANEYQKEILGLLRYIGTEAKEVINSS
jgi:hypothetical protein